MYTDYTVPLSYTTLTPIVHTVCWTRILPHPFSDEGKICLAWWELELYSVQRTLMTCEIPLPIPCIIMGIMVSHSTVTIPLHNSPALQLTHKQSQMLITWESFYCMKNVAFAETSPYTPRESWRIRRIRGKNLCVHRECAKTLLAYSPKTSRDTKLSTARLIIAQKTFLRPFFLYKMGWIKPENHLRLLSF